MDLQEIISRGRFLFSTAQNRLDVYTLVNGHNSAKEIAKRTKRSVNSILNDLKKVAAAELIIPKVDKQGNLIKVDGSIVYIKNPLAQTIPVSYFKDTSKGQEKLRKQEKLRRTRTKILEPLQFPTENKIIDVCRSGEDQLYEFKRAGTEAKDISREIQGFALTKSGGFIFYGVEDNGQRTGTDMHKQRFDQRIQNSIHANINPSLNIDIKSQKITGTEILIIRIPPWNRRDQYQFSDGKTYIRKGANVLPAKQDQLTKLYRGEYVV